MRRFSVVISVLALGLIALLNVGFSAPSAGAQDATPGTAAHPLVGSWVVEETIRQNTPPGSPSPGPRPVAIASFFADGNAVVSGYGPFGSWMQGVWSLAGEDAATFTVVGLSIGGSEVPYGGLERVRATVLLDATGGHFASDYTYEEIEPDGRVSFTRYGSWSGTRVRLEPIDAGSQTPAAETGTGVVTVRLFVCPAGLPLEPWGGPADQAILLAACEPFASPTVAPQLITATNGEPAEATQVAPGVYRWTDLPFGGYFVAGPKDPGLGGPGFDGFRATNAAGYALQNPGMTLEATAPEAEFNYFYFFRDDLAAGSPNPTD
jgi:hypothetical protein